MYSYEERLKAVQLYIQYDKSYASIFRELGYPPSSHSIKLWYKEYEKTGGLHKSCSSANSHFLRTAGPHSPDSPGHIKRTVLEISRAERGLRPANQYRALSQKAMPSQSVR